MIVLYSNIIYVIILLQWYYNPFLYCCIKYYSAWALPIPAMNEEILALALVPCAFHVPICQPYGLIKFTNKIHCHSLTLLAI